MKKLTRLAALLLGAGLFVHGAVAADAFPDRPIKLVVPYAPGGGVDILGRLIAQRLPDVLGQPVVVENRGGGGGTIGAGLVAKAPADGYTLLLAAIEFGANPALQSKLPYDTQKDFRPVSLVATLPAVLIVDPALPVQSVADLVKLTQANPGKYNYASAGIGSMHHLAAELFKSQNKVDVLHVPYQSGAQALTAILGGQTQMAFSTVPPVLQQIRSGKVRALAVTGEKRQPSLPDVPTFAEAGYPRFDAALWQGVLAPTGTSPEVVARLNEAINRVLAMPDVRARLAEMGADAVGTTPERFADFIKSEMTRWAALIPPEMRAN
jgi:tripartite-type tricarboxylate transporter receptor subunit TctC